VPDFPQFVPGGSHVRNESIYFVTGRAGDWPERHRQAARATIARQQQQYPDGRYAGLLPDSIDLNSGRRYPWNINPCNLVSLEMALDGRVDHLSVAADEKHRVAAPFPVTIRDGAAHVEPRAGVKYQVVVDGQRVIDVESKGQDVVPLE